MNADGLMKFSRVEDQIDSLKMIKYIMENHGRQDLSDSSYLHYMNPTTNFTIEDLSSNVVYCDNPHVMNNAQQVPVSISTDDDDSSSSMPSLNDGNPNSVAAMREVIYRIASMQPIHIDPESVKPPKRRNVKISKDPQSVAARHRRERISERIRILQRLVPGGTKMDTASMLDEAVHYVKFLKNQVRSLERISCCNKTIPGPAGIIGFPGAGLGYEL